jgi:hypothetical protein
MNVIAGLIHFRIERKTQSQTGLQEHREIRRVEFLKSGTEQQLMLVGTVQPVFMIHPLCFGITFGGKLILKTGEMIRRILEREGKGPFITDPAVAIGLQEDIVKPAFYFARIPTSMHKVNTPIARNLMPAHPESTEYIKFFIPFFKVIPARTLPHVILTPLEKSPVTIH